MKAENVFDMPRPLSVAGGQPFSKEDYTAEAAILEMPQSPAAIRRSAFLELILRQIPEGVIVSDRQGTIILANSIAKQLAQFDPEGQPLDLAQSIWGELFDGAGAHIAAEDWPLMRALRGERTNGKECRLINLGGDCSEIVFNARPCPGRVRPGCRSRRNTYGYYPSETCGMATPRRIAGKAAYQHGRGYSRHGIPRVWRRSCSN